MINAAITVRNVSRGSRSVELCAEMETGEVGFVMAVNVEVEDCRL
jgi:hypothetical protein